MKILGRMWRIYPISAIFFVHRASAVASPASGTGALDLRAHKCFWNAPLDGTVGLAFNVITTLDGLCLSKVLLTYWGQDKMAAILHTFLFPFPWMKTFKWNVTEICPPVFDWWYSSIGSDNGLAPNKRQAIIWTNDGRFYWRMHASLSLNELIHQYSGNTGECL